MVLYAIKISNIEEYLAKFHRQMTAAVLLKVSIAKSSRNFANYDIYGTKYAKYLKDFLDSKELAIVRIILITNRAFPR